MKIKRTLIQFLKDEEGNITKENILKLGIALGTVSFALVNNVAADHSSHTNTIDGSSTTQSGACTVQGTHTHHGSHTSY